MIEEFSSLEELYNRVKPALYSKKEEMRRSGYEYVKEGDIWNYLKENVWNKAKNLELHEVVSNILNTDNALIDYYLKEKLNLRDRQLYFDGGNSDEEGNI